MSETKSNKAFLIVAIVCAVLLAIVFVRYAALGSTWTSGLQEDQDKIASIQNQIQIKSQALSQVTQNIVQNTTGLDATRVNADNRVAAEFMNQVLTWSDFATYRTNRQICIDEYGLNPESDFMTTFMPEVLEVTSMDGSTYNRIDLFGLNMRYGSMSSYVTKISGNAYSYLAFVTVSSKDETGSSKDANCVFTYKVSNEGSIYDINAYTVVETR